MKLFPIRLGKGFGCVAWIVILTVLGANSWAEIVRGPYLQSTTTTNVTVRWRTDMPTLGMVAYGTNPINLSEVVFDSEDVVDHLLILPDLEPNTRYYYAVGTPSDVEVWGPDYTFKSSPNPGEPGRYRIWAIGDSGTASAGNFGSHWVRDAYYEEGGLDNTDVWLMLGDNAYTTGTDLEYQVAVFDTYPDMLRRVAPWSTIGNHETYSADTNGFFAYLNIFSPPVNGEAGGVASGSPRYYSFDHGHIHFICLDSETSGQSPTSPMMTWLTRDLEQNTNIWQVAFWHTPPYSKGSHDSDWEPPLIRMRTNVVPVLESFGVDLVLSGHSHNYERSYLMHEHYGTSDTLDPSMILDNGSGRIDETGAYVKTSSEFSSAPGTVYVVAGSSGWASFATGSHPAMFRQILQTGSLVIDVDGPRMDVRFLRETGVYEDYFTILKDSVEVPFKVVHFNFENGREVLWWNSKPGRTYVVKHTPSLAPLDWQDVSDEIVASRTVTSWTNSVATLDEEGYFRVEER